MTSIFHRAIKKYVNLAMSAVCWAPAEFMHYCADKLTAASVRYRRAAR